MANFIEIFSTDNLSDVPLEDATFLSDFDPGDTLTWIGGGESLTIEINDDNADGETPFLTKAT